MQLERREEQPTCSSRVGSLQHEHGPAPYRWGDVVRVALDRSAKRGERRIVQVQVAQGTGGHGARDHAAADPGPGWGWGPGARGGGGGAGGGATRPKKEKPGWGA